MAAKITESQKIQMNILYKELKTYAAVAREMGCSPTTVKKYIIPDFVVPEEIKETTIQMTELPLLDFDLFGAHPFGELCLLSDEEREEVKVLWKELVI